MKINDKDGSVSVSDGRIVIYGANVDSGKTSSVFDIMRVGANISKYRKAAGMTQTELADCMNLSFQAVSNWERGQSCPDIANLMALADLFGVTVDKLLGNDRAAELITQISEDKVPAMSEEEIKSIAPILSEAEADGVVRENLKDEDGRVDPEKLAEVAPFVSEKMVDETVQNIRLDDIPASILPFLSRDFIKEMAREAYESGGIDSIPAKILPLVDEGFMSEIVKKAYENKGIDAIPSRYLAYVDNGFIAQMIKDTYEKRGIEEIPSRYLGFADNKLITKMVVNTFNSKGIHSIQARFLSLVSKDAINEMVSQTYYQSGTISAIPSSFFCHADKELLTTIALDALGKHGPEGLAPILAFIDESIIENYYREKWSKG